jgi:hypothetical protein
MNILKPDGNIKDSLVHRFLNKAYDRIVPPEFYARYGDYPAMRIIGISNASIMLLLPLNSTKSGARIDTNKHSILCRKYIWKDTDRYLTAALNMEIINHVLNRKS